MTSNLSNVINYCRIVNGSKGFNDTKTQFINEITQDYNTAREDTVYRFNVLINSTDGKDVYINDSEIPIRGVIDVKKKQTADTEMEESLQVYPNQIKQGDYVKFKVNKDDILRTYLIKSRIEKKHGYDEGIFEECNHVLKWMYQGKVYSAPCIITNQTKYTLGTDSVGGGGAIIEGDSRYQIQMSYNDTTKFIKTGTRFIFNGNAWLVTQTDYVSSNGLLNILLGQNNINYETDNVDLEIADYRPPKIHTYTFKLPTLLEISKDKSTDLLYSIIDENNKDIDYSKVTLTTDSNLITINNIDGTFSITGINIGIGNIKLSVNLNNKLEERIIPFEVKTTVVSQTTYQVNPSNGTLLKLMSSTSLVCSKYSDSVMIPCDVQYTLDTNGTNLLNKKLISIEIREYKDKAGTSFGMNTVWIKNIDCKTQASFSITISDKADNTVILNQQVIQLKGV